MIINNVILHIRAIHLRRKLNVLMGFFFPLIYASYDVGFFAEKQWSVAISVAL